MQGIITILKPSGLTSQQVVNIVKHYYNAKKVGHLGTLDPSGTGVLPICVGKATKLFDYYLFALLFYANLSFIVTICRLAGFGMAFEGVGAEH